MDEIKIKGKLSPPVVETLPPQQCRWSRNPFEQANPLSKLFFVWVLPFLQVGANKNLTSTDLFPIRKADKAETLGNALEA